MYTEPGFLTLIFEEENDMNKEAKASSKFPSIFLRAVVLAIIFPVVKNIYRGWGTLASNFPGDGAVPYLVSGFAFLATFVFLGWVLGTAPIGWLKKGAMSLWRYLVLKRFSALENGKDGSWRGKEVAFAERGRFGEEEFASVFSLGIVTADYGDWVVVFLIVPPGGTSRLYWIRKGSGDIWLTGRPIKRHAETFVTIGNGANPAEFLPNQNKR